MTTFATKFEFNGSTAHREARAAMKRFEEMGFKNMEVSASGEWLAGEFPVLLNDRRIDKIGDQLIHLYTYSDDDMAKVTKDQVLDPTEESSVTVTCLLDGEEIEPGF